MPINIVIFVQACRGAKFDYGVESETTDGPIPEDTDLENDLEKVCTVLATKAIPVRFVSWVNWLLILGQ